MKDRSTSLAMVAVALYVVIAVLAAPAVASPAAGGAAMFRGWQLDGTGLLVRGASGTLELVEWTVSAAPGWDDASAASGYEDQIAELERMSDDQTQEGSRWRAAPEPREWDQRMPDEGTLRGWWSEPGDDARADDRYHAYADGREM